MDQIRIGSFIAQMRWARELTQRQLADMLSISDRTVSKWECGRGLPDASLMLPLCDALGISVNELLSGERVSPEQYLSRAEVNLVELMNANAENRRRMWLSVATSSITVIAVCALIVIAAYIELPVVARGAVIALALVTAVAGITAAAAQDVSAGGYECPHCHARFTPTLGEYARGYHTILRRRLRCPECGRMGMCRRRVTM